MGTATSSNTFFRQTGAAIGTAIFGAVLSNRLAHYLIQEFAGTPAPPGTAADANNVKAIQALPEPVKSHVLNAFTHAIDDVFLIGIPFAILALVVAFFLKEIPLKTASEHAAQVADDTAALAASH